MSYITIKGHKIWRDLDLSIQTLINWTERKIVTETGSFTCENPADGPRKEPSNFCCRSCSKTQCCGPLSQEPSRRTAAETDLGTTSKTRLPRTLEFTNTKKNEREFAKKEKKKVRAVFAAWINLTWHVDSICNTSLLVFMRLANIEQLDVMVGQHCLQLRVGHHWRWSWMQKISSYIFRNMPHF